MNRRIMTSFRNSTAYAMARSFKNFIWEARKELKERRAPRKSIISLSPEGPFRGRVLFSYQNEGFLLDPGTPIPNTHTRFWQSLNMAETFVELGYEVDVIHWTNQSFVPQGNYSFLVDIRHNLERLAPLLNKDCVKIMHLDTAHMLFHNAAGAKRLLQLKDRRGVTLRHRRFERPNLGIEHADYATATGNDFVVGTYNYANKKIFKLPSPCANMYDWEKKDWDQCRKHFLWFSSGGLVHKGLDLALEAFKDMPECHLIVCAPVDQEKDFVSAYYKELHETPNIKTIGWVDIDSDKFRNITKTCAAMVHLSCSEGGAPSIKNCMHVGLIPIVSYESAVDVHDFGFMLRDCSIANIKNVIKHVATLSPFEIEERARKAWEFARRYYTRQNFAREYRKVIMEINAEIQEKYSERIFQRRDENERESILALGQTKTARADVNCA